MNKFKVGDLVVETGKSDVMRVLELGTVDVHLAIGNDDDSAWYYTEGLSLVKSVDEEFTHEQGIEQMDDTINEEEVNQQIALLFSKAINYMRNRLDGKMITLTVRTETTGTNDEFELEFIARAYYDNDVKSDSLMKSATIACNRREETELLSVKSLPLYRK